MGALAALIAPLMTALLPESLAGILGGGAAASALPALIPGTIGAAAPLTGAALLAPPAAAASPSILSLLGGLGGDILSRGATTAGTGLLMSALSPSPGSSAPVEVPPAPPLYVPSQQPSFTFGGEDARAGGARMANDILAQLTPRGPYV